MGAFMNRCRRAQELMGKAGLDWLFISISSDLRYLTGYTASLNERLTLFMVPANGEPVMVMPKFESFKLEREGHEVFYRVCPWQETDDNIKMIRDIAGPKARRIAISDTLWSLFLLRIQQAMPSVQFVTAADVMIPLRIRKDETECENLRELGRRMDRVFDDVLKMKFGGRTELDTGTQIFEIVRLHGLKPERMGGVAAGPNSASPHHTSGDYVIKQGDGIWMELGEKGNYKGYAADKTRVVHVGEPTEEFRKVYDVVREAQETAKAAVRVGMECQEVDRIARKIITDAGYGDYFTHRVGHGLGLDGHEHPYMVEGNTMPIETGMVFSVEPGIYLPGKFGIRIEDIVIATEAGGESIYESTHDLTVVE